MPKIRLGGFQELIRTKVKVYETMRICAALCLIWLFTTIVAHAKDAREISIRVGVLAYRGTERTLHQWTPTMRYLRYRISGYRFVLIPLNIRNLTEAVAHDELHFVLTSTGHFYSMEKEGYGLQPILTLINLRFGEPYDVLGAVVFSRADRDDINSLSDLKGKSFGAVSKNTFSGFQMAWRELVARGLSPFEDLSEIRFMGFPQDKIVEAVLDGSIDSGTVRSDTIEQMVAAGKVKLQDFKILNQQHDPKFPFLLSTRLYPEWSFSKARNTPDDLADKVRNVLLSIEKGSFPAAAGQYGGWAQSGEADYDAFVEMDIQDLMDISIETPQDYKYRSIDLMMKELAVGPYEKSSP